MKRIFALVFFIAVFFTAATAQTDTGRKQYLAHCVGCHGDDGTGGGHGPDIVNVSEPLGVSKSAVTNIILKGIADEGMPAFQIPAAEAAAIAAYVMILKMPPADGAAAGNPAPGDPAAGEHYFTGKGNCTSCHMVRGRGGVLGPDLSNLAHDRKLTQIEQALADPGAPLRGGGHEQVSYRAVSVRLHNGETLRGVAKNESAFDLQLLGVDGKLHLLLKDQIDQTVAEKSLMPKVDATGGELRDLLAYLSRLGLDPTAKSTLAGTAEMRAGVPFADVVHPKTGSWPT